MLLRFCAAVLGAVLLVSGAAAETMLRVASPGNPASLDPHKITGSWENRIVGDMFMGLTTEGPDGSVQPGAAESWTMSEDGLVYRFKIRPHNWSDGTPVTAADFRYSLLRMLHPDTACAYADFFWVIDGGKAYTRGEGSAENVGVRVLSEAELEIRLNRPVAYFTGLLMHFAAMPVPPQVVEQYGGDWIDADNIVVNGAFRLLERVANASVTLKKNPDFYDADNVALDGIKYVTQESREAAVQRYRAGEFDIVRDFPSSKATQLRKLYAKAVRTEPYLGLTFIAINHQRAPFDNRDVRAALSMALNRNIIAGQLLGAGEQAAVSLVPGGTANYGEPATFDWAGEPYPARIERARALMRKAGYTKDRPLKLTLRLRTSENDRRLALAAQSMWRDIFVDADLLRQETAVHYSSLTRGDFDLGLASWLAVYNDPQTFTMLLQESTGANNFGQYKHPDYERITAEAARATDPARRAALLKQAEKLGLADHGLVPVFHHASRNIVAPNVTGWQDNILDVHRSRYLGLR